MTIDTYADLSLSGSNNMCKPCQCNCRTCIGGRAPADEAFNEAEIENALEQLLAA